MRPPPVMCAIPFSFLDLIKGMRDFTYILVGISSDSASDCPGAKGEGPYQSRPDLETHLERKSRINSLVSRKIIKNIRVYTRE